MKKTQCYLIALIAFLTITLSSLAQTNADSTLPGGAPGGSTTSLPQSKADFWLYAIAVVTPMIVMGIKKAMPRIPTVLLPVSTPLIGIGLGYLMNWFAAKNYGWVDMAQLGGLAVFIRESWDQGLKYASRNKSQPPPPSDG